MISDSANGYAKFARSTGRAVLAIACFTLLGAVGAILPWMLTIAVMFTLRQPHCDPGCFIQAMPFFGDWRLNAIYFGAIAACVAFFGIGHVILAKDFAYRPDFQRRGLWFPMACIWLGRAISVVAIGFAFHLDGIATRICLSDSAILYRVTLNGEQRHAWADIRTIGFSCRQGGRGARVTLQFSFIQGADMVLETADYPSTPTQRAHLAQRLASLDLPIKITDFDPGCADEYPPLHLQAPQDSLNR